MQRHYNRCAGPITGADCGRNFLIQTRRIRQAGGLLRVPVRVVPPLAGTHVRERVFLVQTTSLQRLAINLKLGQILPVS